MPTLKSPKRLTAPKPISFRAHSGKKVQKKVIARRGARSR